MSELSEADLDHLRSWELAGHLAQGVETRRAETEGLGAKPESPRDPGYERLLSLLELAERGSRELDGHVASHVGFAQEALGRERTAWWRTPDGHRCGYDWSTNHPPKFTTSLDAALTLVPEELHWSLERFPHGTHTAFVSDKWPVGNHYCGQNKASPALALCIAAIKARSARGLGD